jgi:hypothetical protein
MLTGSMDKKWNRERRGPFVDRWQLVIEIAMLGLSRAFQHEPFFLLANHRNFQMTHSPLEQRKSKIYSASVDSGRRNRLRGRPRDKGADPDAFRAESWRAKTLQRSTIYRLPARSNRKKRQFLRLRKAHFVSGFSVPPAQQVTKEMQQNQIGAIPCNLLAGQPILSTARPSRSRRLD